MCVRVFLKSVLTFSLSRLHVFLKIISMLFIFSCSAVAAAFVIFFTMKYLDFIKSIFLFVLSHSVMSNSLQPQALKLTRLLCQWNFTGKSTGVGCYFLLQGIFLTQGLNLCLLLLLHWQENSWPLVISEISGLYDWTLSSHIKALKRKQRSLEGEETLSPDYLWISNLLAYTDTRILARLHNRESIS